MKVALVHDWLNGLRGGERVLEQLCELYPNADIYTLFYEPGTTGPIIEAHTIRASFLNRFPKVSRYYRFLLPLYPMAIESFDLSSYDLVISTSHCAAKGVITGPGTRHVCYCFTPIRYAWDKSHEYFSQRKLSGIFGFLLSLYRVWDVTSSQRVDEFIGISKWVQKRIQKFYGRKSALVYPPVNTDHYTLPALNPKIPDPYYLVVSAFAPYKRIDMAIAACEQLGRRLLIVGGGQSNKTLRSIAGSHTEFLGKVSDETILELYQGASALLFPGEEDFGIVPLEAQACGCPVIAYGRGGAEETVIDGRTGVLYKNYSVEGLKQAIKRFEQLTTKISKQDCRSQALKFSESCFKQDFLAALTNTQKSKSKPSFSIDPLPRLEV